MKAIRRGKTLSLVTACAFLLNVMLPFFAVYNVSQAAAAQIQQDDPLAISALLGEKVFICTAEGFKWVSWQELQNGEQQPKPHPQYQCALCFVAAHGIKDVTIPPGFVLALSRSPHEAVAVVPYGTTVASVSARGFLTRAPPRLA